MSNKIEFIYSTINLEDFLKAYKDKNIEFPKIQRGLVWRKENKEKLRDTIINSYPFGNILINFKGDINEFNKLKKDKNIPFEKIEIYDGLQRTSTLVELYNYPFRWIERKKWDELQIKIIKDIEKYVKDNKTISKDIKKLNNKSKIKNLLKNFSNYLENQKDNFEFTKKFFLNDLPNINNFKGKEILDLKNNLINNYINDSLFDILHEFIIDNDLLKIFKADNLYGEKNFGKLSIPYILFYTHGNNDAASNIFKRINDSGKPLTELELLSNEWNKYKFNISLIENEENKKNFIKSYNDRFEEINHIFEMGNDDSEVETFSIYEWYVTFIFEVLNKVKKENIFYKHFITFKKQEKNYEVLNKPESFLPLFNALFSEDESYTKSSNEKLASHISTFLAEKGNHDKLKSIFIKEMKSLEEVIYLFRNVKINLNNKDTDITIKPKSLNLLISLLGNLIITNNEIFNKKKKINSELNIKILSKLLNKHILLEALKPEYTSSSNLKSYNNINKQNYLKDIKKGSIIKELPELNEENSGKKFDYKAKILSYFIINNIKSNADFVDKYNFDHLIPYSKINKNQSSFYNISTLESDINREKSDKIDIEWFKKEKLIVYLKEKKLLEDDLESQYFEIIKEIINEYNKSNNKRINDELYNKYLEKRKQIFEVFLENIL